jgi:hypothetical protein
MVEESVVDYGGECGRWPEESVVDGCVKWWRRM